MKVQFEKLYRYDRIMEPCRIAVPLKKGDLWDIDTVQILDGDRVLRSQKKVTSRYEDGSIRYLLLHFMADLPGNGRKELEINLNCQKRSTFEEIQITSTEDGFSVDCKSISFVLKNKTSHLIEQLNHGSKSYTAGQFSGPFLKTETGSYEPHFGDWKIVERGAVCAMFQAEGTCIHEETGETLSFVCNITAFFEKPWIDVSFRLINTTDEERHIVSLAFGILREATDGAVPANASISDYSMAAGHVDSTGCGDGKTTWAGDGCDLFSAYGTKDLPEIESQIDLEGIRTCVGRSNYKTAFTIGRNGARVTGVIDAKLLIGEANEHFGEVFYGAFFADVTDHTGGVCATLFQAHQNYPKAITADRNGISIMLAPEGVDSVVMASGMAREQRFQLHFHEASETLAELDNRSLIYQMPDEPHLPPEVFAESGVMPDIFVPREIRNDTVEIALINKADNHARCYGMMNWGDTPDPGYTEQGRGGGRPVWTNNEYDYPHAMYLMYARTGVRRFFDYANVAASHWMDVDVCHYSNDPLLTGGQWEHTCGHCGHGVMVCSHEWVEGLLDFYHFTGNERAFDTAVGIGENVLRLLETPMYQKSGESNARETGWALRTLTALYVETHEDKWISKCRWIIGHFKEWIEEYGAWVAPYTDNTVIRVGFMISVAVGSLMRYYRVIPDEDVKVMILSAVDDLVDNCLLENGLFYYKELPSLSRNGSNPLLLEAMAIGYELTGDSRYLEYGRRTFLDNIRGTTQSLDGGKRIVEDSVISGKGGTKNFAQSFLPLAAYYKAAAAEGLLKPLE